MPDLTESQRLDFLRHTWPGAVACETATGVPALISEAQACLESGWGAKAAGNALFGIKAGALWKAAPRRSSSTILTMEATHDSFPLSFCMGSGRPADRAFFGHRSVCVFLARRRGALRLRRHAGGRRWHHRCGFSKRGVEGFRRLRFADPRSALRR